MKKEEMFEVLGEINTEMPEKKGKNSTWITLSAVAAACLIVAFIGAGFVRPKESAVPTKEGLVNTMLTVEDGGKGGITDLEQSGDEENYQPATEPDGEVHGVYIEAPSNDDIMKNSTDIYAGMYLNEAQELIVLLTEDTPENRETVCKDLGIDMSQATFKEAKYSYMYLTAIHEKITAVMMDRKYPTIVTSGVMEMENCVEVTLTEEDAEAIDFLSRLDDTGAIKITYGSMAVLTELITAKE